MTSHISSCPRFWNANSGTSPERTVGSLILAIYCLSLISSSSYAFWFGLTHCIVNEVTQELTSTALHQLTELTEGIASLKKRIQERNSLFSELDYYTTKVAKLQKGKISNEKERARKERNEQKLADLRKQFEPMNRDLISDLQRVWSSRLQTLGTAMRDCAVAQQRFSQLLLQAADASAAGDLPVSPYAPGSGAAAAGAGEEFFVRALYDLGESFSHPMPVFQLTRPI